MNKHIEKIIGYTKGIGTEWVRLHKELPRNKKYALIAGEIIVVLILVKLVTPSGEVAASVETLPRKVTVSSLSALSNNEKDLPLIGMVTSVNEATIRSESSGKLNRVYKKLGDTVFAGQTIAEFENSAERASLLQAEGAYEQAKASRDITKLNSTQSGSSLSDAKSQSLNAIYSAYTTMDDAVRGKTDGAFSDAKFEQVKFLPSVPDANLTISIETKRKAIEKMLIAREAKNRTLNIEGDLVTELTVVQAEVQLVKTYLDDLSSAYNKAIQDTSYPQSSIDAGKISVQSARQSVLGSLSALVASRSALSSSITANQVSGSAASESAGNIASAEAQVKQALGAYNAALSRFQKTIIRSPITGTINSLSVDTGDYISAFSQIAVISNNGALEIVSSVNEDDAKRVIVGSKAMINNTIEGVVTRVASAVDPLTKKMEVRIGVKNKEASLINGQSVRVSIARNTSAASQTVKTPTASAILIPLSALKLTPQGANIFTVSTTSTLIAVKVKEGAILGDQIQILEGLTGEESIVVDARGLKEGMEVVIAE